MRSGRDRPFEHLSRAMTVIIFTLAQRWLYRLSVRERLVLATYAIDPPRADRHSSEPGEPDQPRTWDEVVWMLRQAERLQRALIRRAVHGCGDFVELGELAKPGGELAAAFEEAADLLRQLHLQDEEGAHVAPMALTELVGQRRNGLSLTQLRAARDLSLVHELTDDMGRRRQLDEQTGGAEQRWNVRWEASGRFRATPELDGDHGVDVPAVQGWAPHPAAIPSALSRWTTTPRRARIKWANPPPPPAMPRLLPPDGVCRPYISPEQARSAFRAQPDRLAEVVETVSRLSASYPPTAIPTLIAERVTLLQKDEPQLPDLGDVFDQPYKWTWSTTAEWVPTRAVVNTPDRKWGEFDRSGLTRGSRWIPERAGELLAVPMAGLPRFLATHFAGRADDSYVGLRRIPGPAGALYDLDFGGSHRTHLSRILDLPWMFAVTTLVELPRRVANLQMISGGGIEGAESIIELWEGLLRRGIIRGQLARQQPTWIAELSLDYALAPWVLLPAAHATLYNQRYELLYPGALHTEGIPVAALDSHDAWTSWLTTR